MDWSNERYVRLYTRDTTTWKLFAWQARCALTMLLRKADRSGIIEVGETGVEGLSAMIDLPIEVVEVGAADLIRRGTLCRTETAFVLPNFIEAQEAGQSDRARQRESRERRRAESLRGATEPGEQSRPVTVGHSPSRDVTPAKPSQTSLAEHVARTCGDTAQKLAATSERSQLRKRLIEFAWQYAGQRYAELGAAGVDPTAPTCWSDLPAANSRPMARLRDRIKELLDGPARTYEAAETVIRRRVDVAYAEGLAKRRRDWMTPMRMWDPNSFAIASAMSPEQVARANSRATTAADEPALRITHRLAADDSMPPLPPESPARSS